MRTRSFIAVVMLLVVAWPAYSQQNTPDRGRPSVAEVQSIGLELAPLPICTACETDLATKYGIQGGVIGVAVGAILGVAVLNCSDCHSRGSVAATLTFVGGAIGFLMGNVVGYHWDKRLERERQESSELATGS